MSHFFTEEKYNALYQALEECAKDRGCGKDVFKFFAKCATDFYVVSLVVDKLEELGYIIVKK